jgi:hypothetical protein
MLKYNQSEIKEVIFIMETLELKDLSLDDLSDGIDRIEGIGGIDIVCRCSADKECDDGGNGKQGSESAPPPKK